MKFSETVFFFLVTSFVSLLQMDHYVKGKNEEEEEVLPDDLAAVLPENFSWYALLRALFWRVLGCGSGGPVASKMSM